MKLASALLFLLARCFVRVHSKSLVEHQVRVLDQDEQQQQVWDDAIVTLDANQTAEKDNELHKQDEYNSILKQHQQDPMLVPVPGFDHFQAYQRADISSFYQEPPGSRVERDPAFS